MKRSLLPIVMAKSVTQGHLLFEVSQPQRTLSVALLILAKFNLDEGEAPLSSSLQITAAWKEYTRMKPNIFASAPRYQSPIQFGRVSCDPFGIFYSKY